MPNKITTWLLNLLSRLKEEHSLALFITLVSGLVMILAPSSIELLRYQSVETSQGQWWRIISANFCHSNWNHWMLNIAGLWLMDIFYSPVLKASIRALLLIFCMLLNVLFMHYLMDLTWYVGLSGALHGYLVGGAILSWKSSVKINLIILIVVSAKLFVELQWNINQSTETFIEANVVEESHAYGALSALLFCIFYWGASKLKSD